MSILNRPSDGLLTVLLALRKTLLAFGPQSDADLLELAAPSTVVPDSKADMARKTLGRWKQLGFFTEDGRSIQLCPSIAAIPSEDLDALRACVLKLVLAPDNNPGSVSDSAGDDELCRAWDCTRAMAWALAQDPYSFPSRYKSGVEDLQHAQGVEPRPYANDTRWAGFLEWAPFLGVGWSSTRFPFVPNPAFAVRSALGDVFLGDEELPHGEFFRRLAEELPILDGGRYRMVVESQVKRRWREQSVGEISPCLSVAMQSLEAMGVVRLERRSDASQCMLLGREGRRLREVSHVVRLGVA